jgi:hypothetical protein
MIASGKPGDSTTEGFCRYPYDKDRRSHCHVPNGQGRFYARTSDNIGEKETAVTRPGYVLWANAWYYQSAFWGGQLKTLLVTLNFKDGAI